uniref:Metastasis-associated 1 n=1 Tax=Xenopus tropicalis TaxID=8364 RepID=A0A803JLF1_XENTR
MAANMYRVGDYVYFENSSSNPYLIRRIEELNKTANGNVEAKVVCFYRRRDISSTLISLADKHANLEIQIMERFLIHKTQAFWKTGPIPVQDPLSGNPLSRKFRITESVDSIKSK